MTETKEELIEKDKLDIHGFNFSLLKLVMTQVITIYNHFIRV